MKTTKMLLVALAVTIVAPAVPAMAGAGSGKVTVAQDSPYRKTNAVASTTNSTKFQIAPVKMQTNTAVKPETNPAPAAPKTSHVHWR